MSIDRHDFNVEEPSTWGFADARRRVFAVAVQDGRVYYSVAKPLQIWSVGLHADGSFADDARVEIDIKDSRRDNFVTGIVFDGAGTLYLSQRGGLTGSYDYSVFAKLEKPIVRRYPWSDAEKRWSEDAGEYAVGLKDPYRSTLGGIALSYAYGNEGQIDYGKCRETLWTTGEHLREGADKERDYKGGARMVHGLQATDKAQRTAFERAALRDVVRRQRRRVRRRQLLWPRRRHRDLRSLRRAAGCHTEPAPPLNPPAVPQPQTGVWINKVCRRRRSAAPSTAPSPSPTARRNPRAPITIWDAATILAGPGAGGAVTISAVAPDIPNWLCSATPTPNLSCTLAPDWLPPGASHSVDVTVDTAPLVAAGNHGFRNCAVLECAVVRRSLRRRRRAARHRQDGARCVRAWRRLHLRRDHHQHGLAAIQRRRGLDRHHVHGRRARDARADRHRSAARLRAGAGRRAVCMHRGADSGAGRVEAVRHHRDDAGRSRPGILGAQLHRRLGLRRSATGIAACGSGRRQRELRVGARRRAGSAQQPAPRQDGAERRQMRQDAGQHHLCDYEIDLINDGPSPYHGMLTVNETVPAASTLTVVDPAWTCAGGPPVYGCNTLAAVDIAVGASLKTPVTISIPLAPLEAAGCTLPNTAAIVAPPAAATTTSILPTIPTPPSPTRS